ncbi:GNAT family N-acetyltransferase [Streptomyces sp. NPDC054887]
MRNIFLETDRLILRPFRDGSADGSDDCFADGDSDVDRLVALDSDPEVMRYLNGGRPTSRAAVVERVLPRLMHDYACTGTRGFWAAEEKATAPAPGTGAGTAAGKGSPVDNPRTFLGWFEFRPLSEDSGEVVELGYRLGRAAWGRGYATEGARALIDKGFTDLGVQRVTANTMYVNSRSRRVMEKAGLTFVRRWYGDWPDSIEGSEHGEVEYALERGQWKGSRSPAALPAPAADDR